jgi:hypothetical protein
MFIFILFLIIRNSQNNISNEFNVERDTKGNSLEKSSKSNKLNIHFLIIVFFHSDASCTWKFRNYTPSNWETYWFSNIEKFQYEVCSILARPDQVNQTIDVLLRIISLQKSIFDKDSKTISIDNHLSKMHYHQICRNEEHDAVQLIEPLIGLIRDPLTMCPTISSVPSNLYLHGESALQSKRFLLLAPSSPFEIDRPVSSDMYPIPPWLYSPGSQKILIDIGSSYFKSRNGNTDEIGTKWFYDYFKARSIQFDRIIAYEYQQLDPRRVWDELPPDVFPFYTFINVGVDAEMGRYNPWKMLEAIAKPGDYVVLKLDIDKPPLESALMKQLLETNNTARDLIDELFFEKHVSNDRNSKEDKLKDSYELFTTLRKSGIRMHGWP